MYSSHFDDYVMHELDFVEVRMMAWGRERCKNDLIIGYIVVQVLWHEFDKYINSNQIGGRLIR